MARYLETLLRYRLRFLILFVIAPLALGGSSGLLLRGYEGTAALWIGDASYLGQAVSPIDWNPRLSPAQNTTDTLRQLVATHTFDEQVGTRLLASGALSNASVASQLASSLGTDLRVVADGPHLVRLTYSNPSQSVALAVLRTTIALYLQNQKQAQQTRLDVATTFLSTQVTSAQSAAEVAQQALNVYLGAHPYLNPGAGAGNTGVAELDRLLYEVRQSHDNVTQLRAQLAEARYLGAAAGRLVETGTLVVDQPRIADSGPLGDGRSLLVAGLVSLICTLAAAAYLSALVWADQTARDGKELERRLHVPVLTTIPLIGMQERF